MAAISGIINPSGGDFMVFFLNEALQCDLHLESGGITSTEATPMGPMRKPSAFASLMHKNLISVYGVVHHPPKEGESADEKKNCTVSLVSPIVRPTPCITRSGNIAAASHEGDSWLYYLRADTTIMEYVNGGPDEPLPLMEDGVFPSDSTYLAAFCDTQGGRHVFYQVSGGAIHVYNQDDSTNSTIVKAEDTMANTPMAVCMVVKDGVGTAYLYFSSPAYHLRRIQSVSNKKWDGLKTFDNVDLGNFTQLSVIGNDETRKNTIHYHKAKKLNTYTDVLPKV